MHFLRKIFFHQTHSVFFAACLIGFFGLVSRLLGLLRNRLLASYFGASNELDIYYAAFRLPDFIFNIIIIGAVSSVLIPVFSEYWERDKKEAENFLNGLINFFFIFLILLSIILIIFAPYLIPLLVPGFSQENQKITADLSRIMFLSPLFLGLSSILGSVIQIFKKFLAYSLGPVMYNLGIIIGILVFVPFWGLYGLAFGVVLGALLHFLIQLIPYLNLNFRFKFSLNFKYLKLKKLTALMLPRIISISASQFNFFIIIAIASSLGAGSIAVFNFANDFQYLPIGIAAIALSTAAFPFLSSLAVKNAREEFKKKLTKVFLGILFLTVPISILFFILAEPIIRLVLGAGLFNEANIRLTAAILAVFSLSIFAQSLIPLFSRAFFAFQNTLVPVIINIFSVILNIILSFYFVYLIKSSTIFSFFISQFFNISTYQHINLSTYQYIDISVLALPLAFSISSILNFLFLLIFFHKKYIQFDWRSIFFAILIILLSSLLMVLVAYFSFIGFSEIFSGENFSSLFIRVFFPSLIGLAIYFLFSYKTLAKIK